MNTKTENIPKIVMKNSLLMLLCSLVFLGIGYIAAFFISLQFSYDIKAVLFVEGIVLIIIGSLLSMKGNPSNISLRGIGMNNSQQNTYINQEAIRIEKESTDYHKNFNKHAVVELAFSNLTLIASGIFLLMLVYLT